MARMKIHMVDQKEILRLKGLGHSRAEVSKLLKIDRGTVRKYWDGPLPDEVLEPFRPSWVDEIYWSYIQKELEKKASRKVLYEEQIQSVELPSYQAFCEYLRKHEPRRIPEISIKIHRVPGSSIEVDYSGDGVQIINPATGEIFTAQLFVGSLSYSGYFFGDFTMTQRTEDFISSHKKMFEFFGGVTSYIVPDNCKTAVIKNNGMDPIIHKTYQDMCVHYGIVVDPADTYSPQHKPNVENAIGVIQKEFFPLIRNMTFTSLIELNNFFRTWLSVKLQQEVRGRGQSRLFFYEQEKSSLKSLPVTPYEVFNFKQAKVHPDCHFIHEKNYYSVPHQFVGKELDIKFNGQEIHAYSETELIASHPTMKGTYHYSTTVAHYPEKQYVDLNYHFALARREAEKIGPQTLALIERLMNENKYPLKNLRKIQGVIRLTTQFEKEAMEYGCEMAMTFEYLNYDRIRRFAKGYRPKCDSNFDSSPTRQIELVCLQGGLQ